MTELSKQRVDELLEIETKYQKQEAYSKNYRKKRNVRHKLLIEKAIAKGISVSDKEVDDYIKNNS